MRDLSDKRAIPMKRDRTGGIDVIFGIGLGDKFVDGAEFPFEGLAEGERQTRSWIEWKGDESAKKDVTMFRDPSLRVDVRISSGLVAVVAAITSSRMGDR